MLGPYQVHLIFGNSHSVGPQAKRDSHGIIIVVDAEQIVHLLALAAVTVCCYIHRSVSVCHSARSIAAFRSLDIFRYTYCSVTR